MNITLERLEEVKQAKAHAQEVLQGKTFNELTQEEKDLLVETMGKVLGLI